MMDWMMMPRSHLTAEARQLHTLGPTLRVRLLRTALLKGCGYVEAEGAQQVVHVGWRSALLGLDQSERK